MPTHDQFAGLIQFVKYSSFGGGNVHATINSMTIVSGGQTGADRSGLDFAIAHGLPHGGWCPKGRKSEDGLIDYRYQLKETPSDNYLQRTEWNVRDSDGTVIFSIAAVLTGGSKKTAEFVAKHGKPLLHLSRESSTSPDKLLLRFIRDHDLRSLNLAGPRGSKEPQVYAFVQEVLATAFQDGPIQ